MNRLSSIIDVLLKASKLACLTLLLVGCGGGGGGGSNSAATSDAGGIGSGGASVTISGVATDEPVSGGTVMLRNVAGAMLASGSTDPNGHFALEVNGDDIRQGYALEVSGGEVGGEPFSGKLRAIYSSSDDRTAANVTLITTLIASLADQEPSGTPIEKRDAVIQRLSDIGAIRIEEWNDQEPSTVVVDALRRDSRAIGFERFIARLSADLLDGDIDIDDMAYFPQAHGGILGASFGSKDTINTFTNRSGSVAIQQISKDPAARYNYRTKQGLDWVSIDEAGRISFDVPPDVVGGTSFPLTVEITHVNTGHGRIVHGQLYVIPRETVAQAIVEPEGGTVSNKAGDIVVEIPAGAVSSATLVTITRGRDSEGNVVLEVNLGGETDQPYTLYLPNPRVLDANTPGSQRRQPSSLGPASRVGIQSLSVSPDFGATPCDGEYVKDNGADYPLTTCWTATLAYYYITSEENHYYRIPEGAIKLWRPTTIVAQMASELWSSVAASQHQALETKEPVLFVHGFTPVNVLGGGNRTWGNFPELIRILSNAAARYRPFEFRWRTSARFQDVAGDLFHAIQLINLGTHQKVHIMAHSFGGVLVRALLQGQPNACQANSTICDSLQDMVATVTSLGTPHSGIFDENTTVTLSGGATETFPNGQDSPSFEGCKQISCYQMGEPVSFTDNEKSLLGLDREIGHIAKALADMRANPFVTPDLPIQVLIGMTTDKGKNNIADTGDALITYEGQRFHPDLRVGPLLSDNPTYGARVTESVLGFNDNVPPRTDVSNLRIGNVGNGYRHSPPFVGESVARGSWNEAKLECLSQSDCPFDNWHKVRDWLASHDAGASGIFNGDAEFDFALDSLHVDGNISGNGTPDGADDFVDEFDDDSLTQQPTASFSFTEQSREQTHEFDGFLHLTSADGTFLDNSAQGSFLKDSLVLSGPLIGDIGEKFVIDGAGDSFITAAFRQDKPRIGQFYCLGLGRNNGSRGLDYVQGCVTSRDGNSVVLVISDESGVIAEYPIDRDFEKIARPGNVQNVEHLRLWFHDDTNTVEVLHAASELSPFEADVPVESELMRFGNYYVYVMGGSTITTQPLSGGLDSQGDPGKRFLANFVPNYSRGLSLPTPPATN